MRSVGQRNRPGSQSTAAGVLAVVMALGAWGCAASRAYQHGDRAARAGDWDLAVRYYTKAVQSKPDRPDYKIALERAALAASRDHLGRARTFEQQDQLEFALTEYRKAVELDGSNLEARARVQRLEQTIRDRIEAARPRPAIEAMRAKTRQQMAEPMLNPASREPLDIKFVNQNLLDVLAFIGNVTGINITYDKDFPKSQTYSIDVKGVTLEQALQHIMSANQAVFKVLNERSILVYQDTQPKRNLYEEQAIQVFYLSHADPAEMQTLLAAVTRGSPQSAATQVQANKVNNSITVRASVPMLKIIDRIISANDRPRAEIVVDVEILEINRSRAKQYGLDLSAYSVGLTFSPEQRPESVSDSAMFNLNTVSAGISAADFYGSIPSAAIRFLESDTNTKVIAKPQIRGSEGEKLTLKLGTEVPVPSTTFTPMATGGTAYNPMTSFNYKVVGVSVEIEPRVTYDGDIDMKMTVEVSNLGADRNIAGQNLPSFGTRNATTRLRLRDGESNMLAGLLQESERKALKGLPLVMNVPFLKQLFSSNDETVEQTDIVMLLTPHIVRTHELTQRDMSPIYIGTQQNLGLSGPPPLIAAPATEEPPAAAGSPMPPALVTPVAPPARPTTPAASAATPGVPVPVTPAPAASAPVRPPGEAAPAAERPPTVAPTPTTTPDAVAPAPQPDARGASVPAQVSVGVPGPELMVAGGPYTFPIAIAGASRLNTITFALTFNPRVLKVRLVQEGSFMRQGGLTVSFDQTVDAAAGRVDITISRTGDTTGASGAGMLAAIQFDAVSAGSSPLTLSGVATAPGGAPVALQLAPGMVTVR